MQCGYTYYKGAMALGETLAIDFLEPKDELMGLMLVLAIDGKLYTANN
ncbi:MAG: hypothetical protein ACLTS6_17565 [Anaerobutyricum sp.]